MLTTSLSTTEEILTELKAGRMVILVDEEDRENEGDLIIAAEFTTPESINFMAKFGRGLICLTLTEAQCKRLNLGLMTQHNGTRYGTAFTQSIEAAQGVTTGISANDRAHTVLTAIAKNARPEDIVQPGHVFPIIAQPGGVLARAGHTEAGCDLAGIAKLQPAAVICEVMNDDGTMARLPELLIFAQEHKIKIGTIIDLIDYRLRNESVIEMVATREIKTDHYGTFQAKLYLDKLGGREHMALIQGTLRSQKEILVGVHEAFSILDLLESNTKKESWTLSESMKEIARIGQGVIILLNCTDHANHLFSQFTTLNGCEPITTKSRTCRTGKLRTHGAGVQILRDLGVGKIRLIETPLKIHNIGEYGLEITGFHQKT
ncbi:bifunctional 3,4-dihydroxy-2-butanone-4-phosphate synthase/GTP cyclohydrolase II [Candidatus Pandoraea novymonadis]|uniref:3,4-dihydroxy-2-butanone 4-phosphate synthase n=1 Tax=Candidatus Pandoraea novymonadis TaxID=1808959 RepID=A0ABX5FER5_9BURK|nr:bifunctional 3,4-dihydroxy-2-butanone-4-phosphate synthase/GTP cyclohydrolase II [Candidatus Pandoraea novymonadis]PSB92141.1 Riboflavin biosynthesis protein RibBA [Candidatus Pandoraea novymonadis]